MVLADYAAVFRSRKILLLLLLGFSSGLPLALTAGTLQAWLAAENVDIVAIGWFALVGQPYTYKFLWAPLMDRYTPLPALGPKPIMSIATVTRTNMNAFRPPLRSAIAARCGRTNAFGQPVDRCLARSVSRSAARATPVRRRPSGRGSRAGSTT